MTTDLPHLFGTPGTEYFHNDPESAWQAEIWWTADHNVVEEWTARPHRPLSVLMLTEHVTEQAIRQVDNFETLYKELVQDRELKELITKTVERVHAIVAADHRLVDHKIAELTMVGLDHSGRPRFERTLLDEERPR